MMMGLTPERRKELRELARQHNEKQVAEKTEVKAVPETSREQPRQEETQPEAVAAPAVTDTGKGTIGFEPLYRLVHDPRFVEIPKILETPWLCAEGETKKTIPPYKEEIAQLLAKE